MTRVVLLTDFGTADGYAAAMAGVVASHGPDILVEHASHEIGAGDISGAALALFRYALLYPRGTVHLIVVDPGVGTARRAVAAEIEGRYFVAPDNGVLTWILAAGDAVRAVRLPDEAAASSTFHGRDVFAPAAGRLAAGEDLASLGESVSDLVRFDLPAPARHEEGVYGEVLHVDHFGNLITNIPADWVEGAGEVWLGFVRVGPLRRTYGDVPEGELVALIGSIGRLEISVRDGSAADRIPAGRGAPVFVEPSPGASA